MKLDGRSFHAARTYLVTLLSMQGSRILLSVALSLLVGVLNGVGILMLLPLLELVGVSASHESGVTHHVRRLFDIIQIKPSLEVVLSVFVCVVTVQALALRWSRLVDVDVEETFTQNLRTKLYTAVVRCDWAFFVGSRASDFSHVLTSSVQRVSAATFSLLRLISSFVLAAIYLSLALALAPSMSVILIVMLLVFRGLLGRQNRGVLRAGELWNSAERELYAHINDQLAGMKETKALNSEDLQIQTFARRADELHQAKLQCTRLQENTATYYVLGAAVLVAVLSFGSIKLSMVPIPNLIVLVVALSRLLPKLTELQRNYQFLLNLLPAFESATQLLEQCETAREHRPLSTTEELTLQSSIRLQDVGYQYDSTQGRWAIRDVNLTIPAFQTTAIVGPSGAGKSTLVDLLLGLLRPVEGQVLIDEIPLAAEMIDAWRRAAGYVPQETFLLHETIRQNLLWGRPDAAESDVWQALEMAAADEFVRRLPRGLDTLVGDRGVRLSGGERQRIALARALIRRPQVLVLDEATSALDAENQMRIQQALEKLRGELTVILIAHRHSTMSIADQIVILEEGRVVRCGAYDELMSQEGSRLVSMVEAELRTRSG